DLDAFGPWIRYAREYAYAIPSEGALDAIQDTSPNGLIEVGAGGGYWAQLLRERGLDVAAFDEDPDPLTNAWITRSWGRVDRAPAAIAADYPDRTLFLCWPPDGHPMALDALTAYEGQTIALIAAPHGIFASATPD